MSQILPPFRPSTGSNVPPMYPTSPPGNSANKHSIFPAAAATAILQPQRPLSALQQQQQTSMSGPSLSAAAGGGGMNYYHSAAHQPHPPGMLSGRGLASNGKPVRALSASVLPSPMRLAALSPDGDAGDDEGSVTSSVNDQDGGTDNASKDSLHSKNSKKKKVVSKKRTAINMTSYCGNISNLVVRECCVNSLGWRETDQDDCNFWWIDSLQSTNADRYLMLNRQKINYFPGMNELCKKKALSRNLKRLRRTSQLKLPFFPPTFVLPEDWEEFRQQLAIRKPKTFIVKPDGGCQGAGIYLIRTGGSQDPKVDMNDKVIIQRYIHKPLLIDGLKFDFRVYILVTSVDPLRAYIFHDGLARFCTRKYSPPTTKNMESRFMHLTNYSLNKFSDSFDHNEDFDQGSKRSLASVIQLLGNEGHDVDGIWDSIIDLVNKTLVCMYPKLWFDYHSVVVNHEGYSSCFQVLGFDVLLDHRMRPWLLEINHHPSLNMDEPIDRAVKLALLQDAFTMVKPFYQSKDDKEIGNVGVRISPEEVKASRDRRITKHNRALKWEENHEGGYSRCYPNEHQSTFEEEAPYMREDFLCAYEVGARVGERQRGPLKGLNNQKFMRAIKELGLNIVSRHDAELAYIEIMRSAPNPEKGMDMWMFYNGLAQIAFRKFPDITIQAEAVTMLLEEGCKGDSTPPPPPPLHRTKTAPESLTSK